MSSLVNTLEQWVIRRSLGEEAERVPEIKVLVVLTFVTRTHLMTV